MLMNDAAMATPIVQTGLVAISVRTALELKFRHSARLRRVFYRLSSGESA